MQGGVCHQSGSSAKAFTLPGKPVYKRSLCTADAGILSFLHILYSQSGADAPSRAVHVLQVVKLSDAVQPLPRQTTQFIHGVPQQFLAVGDKKSEAPAEGQERFSRGAYFMGKAVWAKGYTELLSLLESHRTAGKTEYAIDCFGNGEDLAAVCILLPLLTYGRALID